jgi:hypothetical protein
MVQALSKRNHPMGLFLLFIVFSFTVASLPRTAWASPQTKTDPASNQLGLPPEMAQHAIVELDKKKYDVGKRDGLQSFADVLAEKIELSRKQQEQEEARQDSSKKEKKPKDFISKKVSRVFQSMKRTAESVLDGSETPTSGVKQILELHWTVQHQSRKPYTWRESIDLVTVWFMIRHVMLNASGRGNRDNPAGNLTTYQAADLSKVDPLPSTFWSRPASIADRNLYYGFDRREIPDISKTLVTYDEPHTGYGFTPGFEVRCGDSKWEVKFGKEHSSRAFGTRIFWALGFPVEITDYAPEIKIAWDRRIFMEFNSRKTNQMKLQFLGVTIAHYTDKTHHNPFDYVKYVVLKDGTKLGPKKLQEQLFLDTLPQDSKKTSKDSKDISADKSSDPLDRRLDPWLDWPRKSENAPRPARPSRPKHPEQKAAWYDPQFEQQIDYLVMTEAHVRPRSGNTDADNLGFWDYNVLDHPKLRELRGMGVLNAWLDNWDIRWGNTRLHLIEAENGKDRIEHVVSDIGALFGNSSGFLRMHRGRPQIGLFAHAPNSYPWAFTRKVKPGQTSVPIHDYMPITKIAPFYQMNIDDARWMARLIAQLTEEQIKQALIASGYDAAWVKLLVEKLVARRDQMILDFGLEGEIALLRPKGPNKQLSYDPNTDGPVDTLASEGLRVTARNTGEYFVVNGELKERPHTR